MGFKDQPRDAHGRFLSPKRKSPTMMPKIVVNIPHKVHHHVPVVPKVSHKPHTSQPRDAHGRFLSKKEKSPVVKSSEPNKASGQLFPEIKGIFSRFF
jgi:hypothetical protein